MSMLDDENLYITANYNIYDADITFKLEEGDLEYDQNMIGVFGDEVGWKLTNRIFKGDFVELVPTERFTVQKATGENPIIGEVRNDPEWFRNSRYPNKSAESGEYNKRIATVRVYGTYVHEMPLVKENADIQAGDYLAFDATEQAFDKSSSATNIIALEPRSALETGKIATMIGFGGLE